MTSREAAIDEAIVLQTGSSSTTRRNEHVYTCPICSKEGHFYVNYQKGVYNCFVCSDENPEARGSIRKLAKLLGVEWDEEDETVEVESDAEAGPVRDDESPVAAPGDFEFMSLSNAARFVQQYCYLYSRGISWPEITAYRIGVAFGGRRVVFPDFNKYNQVRWWQARAIADYAVPRYQGPDGQRWGKIGNYHRALAASSSWLGVCEGPISGIIAGPEFTWVWGKGYTEEQAEVLIASGRVIVIAFDGETKGAAAGVKLAEELREKGTACLLCALPGGHDPASLGRQGFRSLLAEVLSQDERTNELEFYRRATEEYV